MKWLIFVFIGIIMYPATVSSSQCKEYSCNPIINAAYYAEKATGIDHKLLLAIAKVESNWNPRAIGKSHGEVGLMQLRPQFHPGVGFGIKQNMLMGAKYLAKLKKMKYSKWGKAWFVAYNVGPGYKLNYPMLHSYYKKVRKEIK